MIVIVGGCIDASVLGPPSEKVKIESTPLRFSAVALFAAAGVLIAVVVVAAG